MVDIKYWLTIEIFNLYELHNTVNGECLVEEKFRVFRTWNGNRETFTLVILLK